MPTNYTGVPSAIAARTNPTISEPAGADPRNAASVDTPLEQLADSIASLMQHGALLDVANAFSQEMTVLDPVNAQNPVTKTFLEALTTGGTATPDPTNSPLVTATIRRTSSGLVSVRFSIEAVNPIGANGAICTLDNSWAYPSSDNWLGFAVLNNSGSSLVKIATTGAVTSIPGLAGSDVIELTAIYVGA